MKPQELRIGNLISVNGVVQEVIELPFPDNCTSENTNPIPLTEEWLLDFRFSYSEGKYIKSVGNGGQIHIEKTLNNYLFESYTYHTYFKNVHELQNLYYVLTKKELTLTK